MNDAGSTRPEQGTGNDSADAEVFVPPARHGEQPDAGPSAGDVTDDDVPREPPAPLEGYEHV